MTASSLSSNDPCVRCGEKSSLESASPLLNSEVLSFEEVVGVLPVTFEVCSKVEVV